MADYATIIQFSNLKNQLSRARPDFLSKLSTKELQELLSSVTELESNIRTELQQSTSKSNKVAPRR